MKQHLYHQFMHGHMDLVIIIKIYKQKNLIIGGSWASFLSITTDLPTTSDDVYNPQLFSHRFYNFLNTYPHIIEGQYLCNLNLF